MMPAAPWRSAEAVLCSSSAQTWSSFPNTDHALGRRSHGEDLVGPGVEGHHHGLGEHDAMAVYEDKCVRRPQVYRYVPPEQHHFVRPPAQAHSWRKPVLLRVRSTRLRAA